MKILLISFCFFLFNLASAQEKEIKVIRKGDFPEGIYMTLQDVLDKKPTSTDALFFRNAVKFDTINVPDKDALFILKRI